MTAEVSRETTERRFYEQALSEAERAELPAALEARGLDGEIAALRLRLRTVLKDRPEDFALILRGMDVLRRLVATHYGLSGEDEEALALVAERMLAALTARAEGGVADDGDA